MPEKEALSKKKSSFDSNIHVYRAMKRMTQQELADKVGVSRQTIIQLERNRYNPSLLLAHDIADVFEVPIEAIITFKTKVEEEPLGTMSVDRKKDQQDGNPS
ncbi:transcriptional regulator [Enterococcus plantarum]|uniref:Transcriptional regulator n=1 Tax=Enterococcus plantarum TaxID=1077675 RepID=A0A2W3ZNL8_9ENTE|nr:helix-turn-helix transcriptional regulator [Enterococcus plantarum]PZL78207.1 transcriptional regulator [Enterococcus plantarum]